MLAVSWIYMVHNIMVVTMTVGMIKQLFYIKMVLSKVIMFVIWMQLVFIFNDFVIQANFPLEFKYPTILVGFSIGFYFILNFPLIATVMVMIVNLAVNALATNLNIFTLLLTQFSSYGVALANDFTQYTSLVMMTVMIYLIIKTFDVRILDISRYS